MLLSFNSSAAFLEAADGEAWVLVSLGSEDVLTFLVTLPCGSLRFRFGTTAEDDGGSVEDFAWVDLLVSFLEALEVAGRFSSEPASFGKLVSTAVGATASSD